MPAIVRKHYEVLKLKQRLCDKIVPAKIAMNYRRSEHLCQVAGIRGAPTIDAYPQINALYGVTKSQS